MTNEGMLVRYSPDLTIARFVGTPRANVADRGK
jgi:hypothetical protein